MWLQNKGEILIWRENYNHFAKYQCSHAFPLEPQQNNFSNSQAYSEPCQTSKMECFEEVVNSWKLLTYFAKLSILDVWQGSEYTSVICYSLLVKIVDTNKIDSFIM